MKRIKLFLSAVVILAAVAFTYAFTPAKHVAPKTDAQWFHYLGNINGGGYDNPANYEPGTGSGCSGSGDLCSILVEPDGDFPDATALDNMQSEITNAVGNAPTPSVTLKQ